MYIQEPLDHPVVEAPNTQTASSALWWGPHFLPIPKKEYPEYDTKLSTSDDEAK